MLDQASLSPMLTFPRLPAWALIAGVIAPWSRVVMTALDLPRGKPRRQGARTRRPRLRGTGGPSETMPGARVEQGLGGGALNLRFGPRAPDIPVRWSGRKRRHVKALS